MPNELELAILRNICATHPATALSVSKLHVVSREYTGVGSFTNFNVVGVDPGAPKSRLGLGCVVEVPDVPNGLGAILFLLGGRPESLEITAFGSELWDGTFDGFSIPTAV
jgi:hypothetical protein